MRISGLLYLGLALSGVAFVRVVAALEDDDELFPFVPLTQEEDHAEEPTIRRVLRQIQFIPQGGGSFASSSAGPGGAFAQSGASGSFSSAASGTCNCQPIVVCASELAQISQNCALPDGNRGVCCPANSLSNSPDSPSSNNRLFTAPRINVSLRPLTTHQVNAACHKGNQSVTTLRQIENELVKAGMVIKRGTPAAGHLRVFRTTRQAEQLNTDAQAILEASRAMVVDNQLTQGEGGHGLRQVPVRQTILAERCPRPPRCSNQQKYRTSDGSCNNQRHPTWGLTNMPFQRVMPPKYDDGVSNPRIKAVDGSGLPNVRDIANNVLVDNDLPDQQFTLSVMQWAQFVDHDIAHTPFPHLPGRNGIECCPGGREVTGPARHQNCWPIGISKNDAFFGPQGRECMNFVRSMLSIDEECTMGYAEQMNALTDWLDGSAIYGSDLEMQRSIRSFRNGQLRTSGSNMLPLAPNNGGECEAELRGSNCLLAGDSRVNEQPGLTAIHTVFMREHNRVARELQRINPGWSDEALFQEARRIVVAEYQHITYNEWLPIIVGSQFMRSFGISTRQNGFSFDYSPNINPTINNEFATAAFRFGHTLVQGVIQLFSENGGVSTIKLRDHFNSPHLIQQPGRMDDILRSLVRQPAQQFDSFVTQDLSNHLFQTPRQKFGMDLMSINIHRGRDHGIATYNEIRDICGLPNARTFNDLTDQIPAQIVQRLQRMYRNVDDIDFFVGGISERPVSGGLLGHTFLCIVGDQFARLKKGDRYFYDLGGHAGAFNEGQVQELRRASWARILCDNSDNMRSVQPLAFRLSTNQFNQPVDCNNNAQIPKMNLDLWRNERPQA
ncbi:unnamed protein product [Meganyctiphanes norvegica]|uniref:Peroxinectin n=1 Tax=Meganyctiphanes norvegica TaxID=48144 RepID=A0AAV2QGZ3_MEGNR